MAKKTKADKKQVAKGKKSFVGGVVLYQLFLKAMVRSWSDVNGCLLLTNGEAPASFFTLDKLKEILDHQNSEIAKRPAMGINLCSCNMEGGACVLSSLPEDTPACTGIPQMRELFTPEVIQACCTLNVNNGETSKSTMEKAAKRLIEAMANKKGMEARLEAAAMLADTGSRLYGLASSVMETTALVSDLKALAKLIPEKQKQEKEVREFIKDPTIRTFAKAIAGVNAARAAKKTPKKRKWGEDDEKKEKEDSKSESGSSDSNSGSGSGSGSEDGSGSGQSSSSGGGSSGASKKKKKKAKKGKKDKEEDSDEKKEKAKKDKRKKEKKEKEEDSEEEKQKDKKDKKDKKEKDSGKTSSKETAKDKKEKKDEEKKDKKDQKENKEKKSKSEERPDEEKLALQKRFEEMQEAETRKVCAFSAWPQGAVQQALGKLHSLLQEVGEAKDGTFPKASVEEQLAEVPEEVKKIAAVPDLGDEDMIANVLAKRTIRSVLKLATEAEEFWEEKGTSAAGAGGS